MQRKVIYNQFCEAEKETLPLFHFPFWLDMLCGPPNWDVVIIQGKDKNVLAAWPYLKSTKFGLSKLSEPILTPYLGPFIKYPYNIVKEERKRSFEIRVLKECIEALEKTTLVKQGFHPGIKNWTPFYWKGFQQSTRYSYVLNDIKNLDQKWEGLRSSVKNRIRYAEKNFSIKEETNVDNLFALNQSTFGRKKDSMPFTKEHVLDIYTRCNANTHAIIMTAFNQEQNPLASTLLVFDNHKAYSLLIGVDKTQNPRGAVQFLLWESIKRAAEKVNSFDFEGSMIPEVESVFRAFGGNLIPHFVITKAPSWIRFIHEVIRKRDFGI